MKTVEELTKLVSEAVSRGREVGFMLGAINGINGFSFKLIHDLVSSETISQQMREAGVYIYRTIDDIV